MTDGSAEILLMIGVQKCQLLATIPYFLNLISNRANFAVHGLTSFGGTRIFTS